MPLKGAVVFAVVGAVMSRKRKGLVTLLLLCLAVLLVVVLGFMSTVPATSGIPDAEPNSQSEITSQTPVEVPDTQGQASSQPSSESVFSAQTEQLGPMFVVPESPLGALGLFSALGIAFGLFALRKKVK